MKRQTLVLDSSQLSAYDSCPQMWTYENLEKITLSNEARDDMVIGSYGHKLLELYYKNLHLVPPNIAAGRALEFDPMESAEFKSVGLKPESIKSVQDRFNLYWMNYCVRDVDVSFKQRNLVFSTNGILGTRVENIPLVEQGFSYNLLNTSEYLFVLEGRIDLFGKMQTMPIFMDHKWQTRARQLYTKSIQFKNYALATNSQLGIINYIRLHQKVEKNTFERVAISFTPQDLRIWKEQLIEMFIGISNDLKHHRNTRKSWSQCPGKFGYKCQYTKLCEETEPVIIQGIKSAFYKKKEEWKPW